jgi:hypothetical protein
VDFNHSSFYGGHKNYDSENKINQQEDSECLKALLLPYFGYLRPKTLISIFYGWNIIIPTKVLDGLRIEQASPCGRYLTAKLYHIPL